MPLPNEDLRLFLNMLDQMSKEQKATLIHEVYKNPPWEAKLVDIGVANFQAMQEDEAFQFIQAIRKMYDPSEWEAIATL